MTKEVIVLGAYDLKLPISWESLELVYLQNFTGTFRYSHPVQAELVRVVIDSNLNLKEQLVLLVQLRSYTGNFGDTSDRFRSARKEWSQLCQRYEIMYGSNYRVILSWAKLKIIRSLQSMPSSDRLSSEAADILGAALCSDATKRSEFINLVSNYES